MKYLRLAKNVITCALIALAVLTVYKVAAFMLSDSWSSWGLGQLLKLSAVMLRYVFSATIIYIIPPVLIYCVMLATLKNPFVRAAAGIGCVYIFWLIGGGQSLFTWENLSAPLDSAIKIARVSAQIYLLVILVMPSELMSILETVTAVVGSMVIYVFPDAPGALDDISAVCALVSMIFDYLNTLTMLLKQHSGKIIGKLAQIFSRT